MVNTIIFFSLYSDYYNSWNNNLSIFLFFLYFNRENEFEDKELRLFGRRVTA